LEHVRYGDQESMFRLRITARPKGSGARKLPATSCVVFLLRVNKD